jgi:WhiB family redox-sensing transcriptional regulator
MSLHTIARDAATSPTERRPGPDWGWRHQGLCLGLGAADFFDEGERGRRRDLRVARAKATCAQCPVLERCREQALSTRERYGIWGGLTEVERERILATSDLEQAS